MASPLVLFFSILAIPNSCNHSTGIIGPIPTITTSLSQHSVRCLTELPSDFWECPQAVSGIFLDPSVLRTDSSNESSHPRDQFPSAGWTQYISFFLHPQEDPGYNSSHLNHGAIWTHQRLEGTSSIFRSQETALKQNGAIFPTAWVVKTSEICSILTMDQWPDAARPASQL